MLNDLAAGTTAPTPAVIPAIPLQASAPALAMIQDQLNNYVRAMSPSVQMGAATAVKQQHALWRTLSMIFQQPPSDFPALWGAFLQVVQLNQQGVFSKMYVFRGFAQLKGVLSDADIRNFKALITLAIQTADPTTRSKVRQFLDLGVILKGFANPMVSQLITDFYRA